MNKKRLISVCVVLALLSGCSVVDKTASLLNFVKTYGEESVKAKPDWSIVRTQHQGDGVVKIVAYKNSANAALKVAAQHKDNFRSTALLFPDEKNFIVATAVFGRKSATIILNDVDGVRNQEFLLTSTVENNQFVIESFTNTKTGEGVAYKITSTPTSNP